MKKFFFSLGVGVFVMSFAFTMLITSSAWGQHLLSWHSGYWQPLKSGDDIQSFLRADPRKLGMNEKRLLRVEGDVSGVEAVLISESEPEISVYIDSHGKVIAARLGIASVMWGFTPWTIAGLLMWISVGLILTCQSDNFSSQKTRFLGLLLVSLSMCYVSALLLEYLPLTTWAIAVGLSLLLVSIVLGLTTIKTCFGGLVRVSL
ncbi:MAG: hypothetical protein KIT45_15340 [Fimbriimonadia bacterium]|nr:hypothetical protein [Fimbriimonadia bacterium]